MPAILSTDGCETGSAAIQGADFQVSPQCAPGGFTAVRRVTPTSAGTLLHLALRRLYTPSRLRKPRASSISDRHNLRCSRDFTWDREPPPRSGERERERERFCCRSGVGTHDARTPPNAATVAASGPRCLNQLNSRPVASRCARDGFSKGERI